MKACAIRSAIRTFPSPGQCDGNSIPGRGPRNPRLRPPQVPRRGLWHLPVMERLPACLILSSSILKKLNSRWLQLRS